MNSSGRVSIKDVARLANVSQGTVSHVLNHPDRVSPVRREAVEKAIRELGFVRHEAARHLRAGYSSTVGLLLLDAWNPGFTEVARGVEDTTMDQGWTVVISNSARDIEREKTYLRLFYEQRVAGLIVVPHDQSADDLHQIRSGGAPVVVVDRPETGDHGMSVAVDDVAGGELAARHLISLGHRHVAFIGDEAAAAPVHARLIGVRKAVAEAGVDIRLDVIPAELTAEAGRETGEMLAAMPAGKRPTAVAAAIDLLAIGVLQAFLQHGIGVPDDISLCGYDDIPFTRQLSVPLTTVHRSHYDMGTTAAEMLTSALSGQVPDLRHVVFQPELVVRQSTGPVQPRSRRRTR
ncbi:MAG: substrate-binding domain-containing protein [Actinophytocola sp.]|nr:substrate-binding domain-containing protein [Actinophytocola sp.]